MGEMNQEHQSYKADIKLYKSKNLFKIRTTSFEDFPKKLNPVAPVLLRKVEGSTSIASFSSKNSDLMSFRDNFKTTTTFSNSLNLSFFDSDESVNSSSHDETSAHKSE